MRLIAIGDIHGCLNELKELLGVINPGSGDRLIFIGDYIDRGPDSVGVVKYLFTELNHIDKVFLMGNHDALFLYYYEDWKTEFGAATLRSMEASGFEASLGFLKDQLKRTRLVHQEAGWLFVHGGLRNEGVDDTPDEEKLQLRNAHRYQGKIPIVVGHTPVCHAVKYENAVNVDTGCFATGLLSGYDVLNDVLYTNRGLTKLHWSRDALPEP